MPEKKRPTVLLGNFDGVHLGHRALAERAREIAASEGTECVVWTFRELPKPGTLTPASLRSAWLKHYGADEVVFDSFTRVRNFSPRRFFEEIILGELNAGGCVCGFNYRFGKGGSGDSAELVSLCREYGLVPEVVGEVKAPLYGERITVSSTKIRELLETGDVKGAGALLGHPHVTRGTVCHGKALGRTAGFPTANVIPDGDTVTLPNGVYATFCLIDGKYYPSVTNIGKCPTVTENGATVSETHIIGFSGDLYGRELYTGYLDRIREERKFSSAAELFAEIARNAETAKRVFANHGEEIFIPAP